MADNELQRRIERLGRLLVEELEFLESSTRDRRRATVERVSRHVHDKLQAAFDGRDRKQRRRDERERRKAEAREKKRREALEGASTWAGGVLLTVATFCLFFVLARPMLWWLVFVALGLGLSGAHQLHLAGERKRLLREGGGPLQPARDPAEPAHEVDALCDQLLQDLKDSPEVVRGFLQNPEKTVSALRQTCKALDGRRRQLLSLTPQENRRALAAQREGLAEKREATRDPTAREKLDAALMSIDSQLSAVDQLQTTVERVDGEYTSLLVLLQELRTRVAVAKSASSPMQLEGLRLNVQRLNDELGAIADALQAVPQEGLAHVSQVEGPPAERGPSPRVRQGS